MSELNYASLEASKKLIDTGIVLKTESVWRCPKDGPWTPFLTNAEPGRYSTDTPAPSMAEVWRELPETNKLLEIMADYLRGNTAMSFIRECAEIFRDINKLIDLLIWVRKEKP